MLSLATAVHAANHPVDKQLEEHDNEDGSMPNESPQLKSSNQEMETEGNEELGKHLEDFINNKAADYNPDEEEISFGGGRTFFCHPSASRAVVVADLRSPNLQHVFWASIHILVPKAPENATDAMFDALDEFLTKMKEADRRFAVFLHNISKYGTLANLPCLIEEPEDLPTEVDEWLEYFPQAKPCFYGGDVYTLALIGSSIPLGRLMKEQNEWFKESRCWTMGIDHTNRSTCLSQLVVVSMNNTNTDILKKEISRFINDIPVSLRWKMVSLGTQGKIAPENIVRALHIYVDEMDGQVAKPRLMTLYAGNASIDHKFPLHICMQLIPEIDSVLKTQGRHKIDKLNACQATWTMTKLVLPKTWEFEFLDKCNPTMGMSLRDAMMAIKHPANPCFSLFHSIDQHWKDDCYVVTCLKLADSLAHAMVAALLPYLTWMLETKHGKVATAQVPKWFKPAARLQATDAFWDPKEECVQNKSDEMLNLVMSDADGLYWEVAMPNPNPPKQKKGES